MKKLGFLLLTLLFSWSLIQGQAKETKKERVSLKKLEGGNVSELAKNNFMADFRDATNPVWSRLGTYDQVAFTNKNGHKMNAYYDFNSKLVGTTEVKIFSDLPDKGQQEIKTKYKDYKVGPIIFYDDNEVNDTDMILYGVQFDDADNYFVELTKGAEKIVLRIDPEGTVYFFKQY